MSSQETSVQPHLLIATIPAALTGIGGASSMVNAIYEVLDNKYKIGLINSPSSHSDPKHLSLRKIICGKWRVGQEQARWNGRRLFTIGRRFHYLEPLHYLDNAKEWTRCAQDYQMLMVVSGTNQCGLAFALSGRRYVCWTAAITEDDKWARKRDWPKIRQIIDTLWAPLLRYLEGYIYRRCSSILSLSVYTANMIANLYKINRQNVQVLPYPIDIDWFSPPPDFSKWSNNKTIISVSRLNDPRKNICMLVKAFSWVKKEIPDARLILLGDKPNKGIVKLVDDLDLKGHILFPDSVSNKTTRDYYRQSSIFAISSYQEGLGIAGLEAMSCGLSVVSTKCGGPEEYVRKGVTGFLVPINDEHQMASKLTQLLSNSQLRRQLGLDARDYVVRNYSIERFTSRLKDVLASVWPELHKGS